MKKDEADFDEVELQAAGSAEAGAGASGGGTGTGHGGSMTNSSSNKVWDGRMEFDPITATYSGSTVWRDYGDPPHIIITKPGENPRDVVRRQRQQMKLRFHVEDN